MDVFVVQHVHVLDDDDEKLIGVYSSKIHAEAAVRRLRLQPGFSETPDGFTIDLYRVDQDHWCGGFVTIHPPHADQEDDNSSP